MSTEYHQLPSQQGKMPLDYIADSDPWLISATSNLSLDAWAPPSKSATTKSLNLVVPTIKAPKSPLFEHVGHDSDAWAKTTTPVVPDITNIAIKKPNAAPNIPKGVEFFSTASKIDAWTVTAATTDSKKKTQLKQQQQQAAQQQQAQQLQVQQQQQQQQQDEAEDEEDKAIEDELAIQNRYKTELCKSFTETGVCRYGSKCQFAHGKEEMRPILRHPKYKTETCKTFHSTGTCPYGIRCRFIHTRAKDETVFVEEERGSGKVAPPPGIPVPQWSKSWSPSLNVAAQKKSSSGKKHGLGKIQLEAADY